MKPIINAFIFLVLLPLNIFSQVSDIETYYAKRYMMIIENPVNGQLDESVLGKNVTIKYDNVFNKIELHFIDEEGKSQHRTYKFIRNTENNFMIMSDAEYGGSYLISFDPTSTKTFYKYPNIKNPMTYTCIRNISKEKNW
jgi:hypothetical protein